MANDVGKIYVGWSEINALTYKIKEDIMESHNWPWKIQQIVGISRGGLVPGIILSHMFNVPFCPLVWQTRDNNDGRTNDLGKLLELKYAKQQDILFVDDICDSGLTIEQIRKHVPYGTWAVLYSKLDNMGLDFVGKELYNDDRWLIFPWERNE